MKRSPSTGNSQTLWHRTRLGRLAFIVLAAISLAVVVSAWRDFGRGPADNRGMVLRGDFPAFYGAAMLVSQGRSTKLYDQLSQQRIENEHWPSLAGSYYSFTYPPYVALLLLPVAWTSAILAKLYFTAVMLICVAISIWIWSTFDAHLRDSRLFVFAFILSCAPVFIGVFSGQNNALAMLLCSSAVVCLTRRGGISHFVAGVCVGLWLFKPQHALVFAIFALPLGGRIFAAGFFSVACFYYWLGLLVLDAAWPLTWLKAVREFSAAESVANAHQLISVPDILYYAASSDSAGLWQAVQLAVILLSLALIGRTGYLAFGLSRIRERIAGKQNGSMNEVVIAAKGDPIPWLFFAMLAVILLSPHVLFYDCGIFLLPLTTVCVREGDRGITILLFASLWISLVTAFRASETSILLTLTFAIAGYLMMKKFSRARMTNV